MKYSFFTKARAFKDDESGATMVWNIFWTVIFLLFAGLAMDTANAHRMRMVLQITADSAVMTAAMTYAEEDRYTDFMGAEPGSLTQSERATAAAVAMAVKHMGTSNNGNVLTDADVQFGSYTSSTGFVPDENGVGEYVQVTTRRSFVNSNGVDTFFLGMFSGLQSWDIAARAVAGPDDPPCLTDGIVTADILDFQSRNNFTNNICLHGNSGVEVNQNNTYETGVIVSLPSPALLTVPAGNTGKNEGLDEALRYYPLEPKLAYKIDEMREGFQDLNSDWMPDYVKDNPSAQIVEVAESSFDPETMVAGNVYKVVCGDTGNNTLNLRGSSSTASLDDDAITNIQFAKAGGIDKGSSGSSSTTTIKNVVVITNCKISLDKNTIVEDAIIATSSTDAKSVQGSSGVAIGLPDDCAEGGGAQIITNGGMHFAAKMEFHGSQLIAGGAVSFGAQVDGLGGTSVQALGRVDLASNNDLAICPTGSDQVLTVKTYRMFM